MKSNVGRVVVKWLLLETLRSIVIRAEEEKNTNFTIAICDKLPSFCRYIEYSRSKNLHKSEMFVLKESFACEKGLDAESAKQLDELLRSCSNKGKTYHGTSLFYISIAIRAPRSMRIVNDSFRPLFDLNTKEPDKKLTVILKLFNIKGFDIDSAIPGAFRFAEFEFYTDFNLYKQNRVVKSCRDFYEGKKRGFIFQNGLVSMLINRPRALHPICSLFFRHARINVFQLHAMADSFYMKNSVRFVEPDNDNATIMLDSSISNLHLDKIYELDLDSKLLNAKIFASTSYINIFGQLRSIESDVFTPLRKLHVLIIWSETILDLIRRQGIAWIKGINVNVRVDLTNQTNLIRHKSDITQIKFGSERTKKQNFNIGAEKRNDGNEADFCLFVEFPFRQMVFLEPDTFIDAYDKIIYKKYSFSCTELWLYQFHLEIKKFYRNLGSPRFYAQLNASNFSACEFERRIELCNRSKYHLSAPKRNSYSSFDLMVSLEFSFLIILPSLFAVFGIVTNIIVIIVILHDKNKMTMRKKHYIYMSLHCLTNVLICFIQFVNLLNECQYPYTRLFCSSIRHFVGIQYLRIIFGEYLNSVLRLVSNFTYFGFSICRLSKIGTNHSKFTVFFNEKLSIKVYMSIVVVISAGLCVCKCLQFNLNYGNPDLAYPLPFIQNPLRRTWTIESGFLAIFGINIINNAINYFLFVCVHLGVDFILIKKLWQVMREKEEKMKEMKRSEKEIEKMSKENEESKRRTVIMVICNSTLNFGLKMPLLIPALNDLRLLIYNSKRFNIGLPAQNILNLFSSPFNFEFYCVTEKSCQIFQSFGNCLFLVSLSSILCFLKHFDMNFKCAFTNVFHQKKKNSNKN